MKADSPIQNCEHNIDILNYDVKYHFSFSF